MKLEIAQQKGSHNGRKFTKLHINGVTIGCTMLFSKEALSIIARYLFILPTRETHAV